MERRERREKKNSRRLNQLFHSGESRNLILAIARIFREAEHCNGRLSANAAVAAEIPAFAGMEEGEAAASIKIIPISLPFHSRESGNLPTL